MSKPKKVVYALIMAPFVVVLFPVVIIVWLVESEETIKGIYRRMYEDFAQ